MRCGSGSWTGPAGTRGTRRRCLWAEAWPSGWRRWWSWGSCGLAVFLGRSALPPELAQHVPGAFDRAGELLEILALATVIMVMGLIDDRKNLKWQLRMGIQFLCATILAASGIRVTLFWPFTHPLLGGAVTVLWIVGLTNSFNMLDNMDGLAASVGLIAAGLFCVAQVAVGSLFAPAVLLILVGALGGFLVHNHAPARLYMGDAGSNFLGFLAGCDDGGGNVLRVGHGLAIQRAGSAPGDGGAALRHGLGGPDSPA